MLLGEGTTNTCFILGSSLPSYEDPSMKQVPVEGTLVSLFVCRF